MTSEKVDRQTNATRDRKPMERIDHIVVIYQENWSFDSLFGLFPGADGIANAVNASGDLLFPQVSKRSCSPPLL
jgi:phospholipase C